MGSQVVDPRPSPVARQEAFAHAAGKMSRGGADPGASRQSQRRNFRSLSKSGLAARVSATAAQARSRKPAGPIGRRYMFAKFRGRYRACHHLPVLDIDAHGSCLGRASPLCSNSIETLSGERTNAIRPSRGGRLIVTPAFISRSHTA